METEGNREEYSEKEIDPIYDGDLSVKNNPILGLVAEMNQSFITTQKLLDKSDWDYKQNKKEIEEMIQLMPKYSQTIIISVLQKLVMHADQSTFLGRQQQEILKKGIQDMIEIARERYNKDKLEQSEEDFDFVSKDSEESEEYQNESGFVSVDKDPE